jgi:DNA repair protein RAD50
MAQVKLGFKTATGAQFVVSRSMQLTVSKTTRKFKSLDGSLLMIKDGERTSMSTRVGGLVYPLYYPDKVICYEPFVLRTALFW